MIVADASVIAKWFLPDEPQTPEALNLRLRHVEGMDLIAVPLLLYYELANVLALTPRLSVEEALEAWASLADCQLETHSPQLQQTRRAMRLARKARVSAYDATYVALAEALECDYVTADAKLVNKLRPEKLACRVLLL